VVEYAPGARVIHIDAGPHRHVDKYDVLDYLPEFACGVQRFRALMGVSYDVIHSHYWLSGRLGLLFADHWGVPLVSTFHTLAQLRTGRRDSRGTRAGGALRNRTADHGGLGSGGGADAIDRQQTIRHYGAPRLLQ
jgi:D-inositol-3-phosphate glycosyltransferase